VECKVTLVKLLVALLITLYVPALVAEPIQAAADLAGESQRAVNQNRVYLLYVSRLDCPYCARLEKNVLFPMLRNDEYVELVDLREISYEGGEVVDFDGQTRASVDIIRRYGIIGTPTLLFLDEDGAELADRIVGYHSEDFYWFYFDKAIEEARRVLIGR
jgi:thioredoxin-related protein